MLRSRARGSARKAASQERNETQYERDEDEEEVHPRLKDGIGGIRRAVVHGNDPARGRDRGRGFAHEYPASDRVFVANVPTAESCPPALTAPAIGHHRAR